MKKNALFLVPIIVITALIFMLRATGMKVHIIASLAGLLALIAYTLATKKQWKCPAFEISLRVFYATALITGISLMGGNGTVAVSVIHKISAVLFAILLIACEIEKAVKK